MRAIFVSKPAGFWQQRGWRILTELKRFLIDRNHENWARVYWERGIFQILGSVLATIALYRATNDCFKAAARDPGSHAIVWYGLAVLLISLSLIGGQILGAV